MTVLEIKELSKSYGKLKALDGLNLTIESGHVYGILGPNGSGKTTTLGIILDILKQDSGTYSWFGGIDNTEARLKIGAILETPNFYPYLHAIDNLDIIRQIKRAPKQDFTKLLELVGLAHRRFSSFRTYSLGMKQRLAIAATLIGDADVLIFDEPTNGLDPQGIAEVRNILKRISDSGRTVIMASHILDEVEKICSHVAIIKNGVLRGSGPIGTILSNDSIVEIDAHDRMKLLKVMNEALSAKSLMQKTLYVEGTVSGTLDAETIARTLYTHDVIPTHFVVRKRRLEEDFLEMTKD